MNRDRIRTAVELGVKKVGSCDQNDQRKKDARIIHHDVLSKRWGQEALERFPKLLEHQETVPGIKVNEKFF